jgi:hypothetical protein
MKSVKTKKFFAEERYEELEGEVRKFMEELLSQGVDWKDIKLSFSTTAEDNWYQQMYLISWIE